MRAFHLGKLNGWHRIGVVLSVGWFLFLTANAVEEYITIKNSPRASYAGFFLSRELSDEEVFGKPPAPRMTADKFLDSNAQGKDVAAGTGNPFDDLVPQKRKALHGEWDVVSEVPVSTAAPHQVLHFNYGKFLALALIPVISAWVGAYLIVWVTRWVIAGFKRT